MRLVYKFNTYDNKEQLFQMCRFSKDLYNQALYAIKTNLKENKFTSYDELYGIMKETTNLEGEINYRKLKAQVAQQCLKTLDKMMKSYFKSVKDWSKNKDKYSGKPNMPHYKRKDGYNQLIYPNQSCTIKDGRIYLSRDLSIRIPQYEKYGDTLKDFQQVRINPKKG